jgi:hypothetical protein
MKTVYIISRKIYQQEAYWNGYGWTDLKNLSYEFTSAGSALAQVDTILKDPTQAAHHYEIQTCYRR